MSDQTNTPVETARVQRIPPVFVQVWNTDVGCNYPGEQVLIRLATIKRIQSYYWHDTCDMKYRVYLTDGTEIFIDSKDYDNLVEHLTVADCRENHEDEYDQEIPVGRVSEECKKWDNN